MIAPNDSDVPLTFKLHFKASNNQAEYEVCIVGLEATLELEVKRFEVIADL